MENNQNIIIYYSVDGKASVALYAKDGSVWMNQNQLAELSDTSKQNISLHILNILEDNELEQNSVIKDYLTTATYGKNYNVTKRKTDDAKKADELDFEALKSLEEQVKSAKT